VPTAPVPPAPGRGQTVTRAYPVPSSAGTAASGAVGGAVAGAVALGALAAGATWQGHHAVAGPNAIGAWLVRWLQIAAPDALEHFYWDASCGGAALVVLVGALGGALFALFVARLPEDHPIAWGVIAGAFGWAGVRWAVGPAIDPVLVRVFDWRVLLPAGLAYGIVLGAWVHLGRGVAARVVRRLEGA
jgi:hypothetical protein